MGTPANPPPQAQPTVTEGSRSTGWSIPAKYRARAGFVALGIVALWVLFSDRGERTQPKPAAKQGEQNPHDLVTPPRVKTDLERTIEDRQRREEWDRARRTAADGFVPPPPGNPGPTADRQNPEAAAREEVRARQDDERRERARKIEEALHAPQVAFSFVSKKQQQVTPALATTPEVGPEREPATTVPAVLPEPEKYTLSANRVIDTLLHNGIEASFPGPVVTRVSVDVRSSPASGLRLLIPAGSSFLGTAAKVTDSDQERVAVIFHRLILPNEESISLEKVSGLSQEGATGIKDLVDHHYWQTFGVVAAVGAISGLTLASTQANIGYYNDGSDAFRRGMSQSTSQIAMELLRRNLYRPWTVTIRPGKRVQIILTTDLKLPEYREKR